MIMSKWSNLKLRAATIEKMRRIAAFQRRTICETVDVLADEFIAANSVPEAASVPNGAQQESDRVSSVRKTQPITRSKRPSSNGSRSHAKEMKST
jgi:hypothetical protein